MPKKRTRDDYKNFGIYKKQDKDIKEMKQDGDMICPEIIFIAHKIFKNNRELWESVRKSTRVEFLTKFKYPED